MRSNKSRSLGKQGEKAGLYVRVSLDKRVHKMAETIESPETQEDRARAYCMSQGWTVAMVRQDLDESGYRQHYTKREGLMDLLAAVERGEITKIVVFKFSRLSRRLKDFSEICDRVEAKGAGVVSVTEQSDTSTPSGKLIRNILASFAQYQSEELSEQIAETWLTKAKRGERPPGKAPYGTRLIKGLLEPDPETHPTLLRIFRTFAETRSIPVVVDLLNSARVPAPGTDDWSVQAVRRILANPAYIAAIQLNEETFEGRWSPLVPPDLWQECQVFLRRRPGPANRVDSQLLRGHVICGCCGRPMWTQYATTHQGGQRVKLRQYWCADPRTGRDGCDMPALNAQSLEEYVWSAITTLFQTEPEVVKQALDMRNGDETPHQQRRQLVQQRDRVEQLVKQLFELLADGHIDRQQFAAMNREYAERLASIQRQIDELDQQVPVRVSGVSFAEIQRQVAKARTIVDRRTVLDELGVRILVTWRKVELEVSGAVRIRLPAALIGERWYIGEEYTKLDYQGTMLTDRQIRFVMRTWKKHRYRDIAERIGRTETHVKTLVRKLRNGERTLYGQPVRMESAD